MAPTKRQKTMDSDNDSDTEFGLSNWPRFLVIESSDPDLPLSKLSPFAVEKGIKGMAGDPANVQRMSYGFLVEVTKESHSRNLLQTNKLANVPVRVSPHRSKNSCRGVIWCRELRGMTDEEIQEELKTHNVTYVKRILLERRTKQSDMLILTFGNTTLPKSIKIGYMSVVVRQYIPNPLRCFKCQRFGHGTNSCRGTEICAKCGKGDHSDNLCIEQKPSCINCKGEHSASDRNCPKYLEQKSILRIKFSEGVSFPEAKKRFEVSNKVVTTYASVTKRAVTTNNIETQTPAHCNCEKSEKAWKTHLDELRRDASVKVITPSAFVQAPPKVTTSTQVSASCSDSSSVHDRSRKDRNIPERSRPGSSPNTTTNRTSSNDRSRKSRSTSRSTAAERMDTDSSQPSSGKQHSSKSHFVRNNFNPPTKWQLSFNGTAED